MILPFAIIVIIALFMLLFMFKIVSSLFVSSQAPAQAYMDVYYKLYMMKLKLGFVVVMLFLALISGLAIQFFGFPEGKLNWIDSISQSMDGISLPITAAYETGADVANAEQAETYTDLKNGLVEKNGTVYKLVKKDGIVSNGQFKTMIIKGVVYCLVPKRASG